HRAPEGRALIRCFFGGLADEGIMQSSDEQVLRNARQDLRKILNLEGEPLFTRVFRWPASMPQYAVGHLERLERIDRLGGELPGLALAGNAYRGIGLPDCVRSGKEAAERILKFLGMPQPEPVAK